MIPELPKFLSSMQVGTSAAQRDDRRGAVQQRRRTVFRALDHREKGLIAALQGLGIDWLLKSLCSTGGQMILWRPCMAGVMSDWRRASFEPFYLSRGFEKIGLYGLSDSEESEAKPSMAVESG